MQNPFHRPPACPATALDAGGSFDSDGNIYEVDLMFYKPQPEDHYFNHIVAAMSGPFSHVEIVFPSYTRQQQRGKLAHTEADAGSRVLFGSSIFQNQTVFFRPKSYSRAGYTSLGIRLNRHQHNALLAFCTHAAQAGVRFDGYGMLRAALPLVFAPHDPTKTFCSKYVTDALQYAGVPEASDLDGRTTTPSSLYEHIRSNMKQYSIVSATPEKMKMLSQRVSESIRST
jgi:hypothetical protein